MQPQLAEKRSQQQVYRSSIRSFKTYFKEERRLIAKYIIVP